MTLNIRKPNINLTPGPYFKNKKWKVILDTSNRLWWNKPNSVTSCLSSSITLGKEDELSEKEIDLSL